MRFQQDVRGVRGAAGGRVLPAEERRHSGWEGHAHHSQTRPHVPAPPLGTQRWGPLHRRERQTRARHTQVGSHRVSSITGRGMNTNSGSSRLFQPSTRVSRRALALMCFVCLDIVLF